MSGEICTDNRFEIIAAYKKKLVEETNIQESPDEMAVIDNILFRFWQMGWLPPIPHGRLIDADKMRESIRTQTAFLRLMGEEFAEIAEALENGFLQEIDNAPTIIPANEKEKLNDNS